MLRQYHELKRAHPGALLFFRLGDFYEMFFDDAVTCARELDITLTARQKDSSHPIPMCGVPHHAASIYIARLIRKGYRVAVCEQVETADAAAQRSSGSTTSSSSKLVRREVVRVITPGTAIDPQLIESGEASYLASVCGDGKSYGVAFLDVTTGEFCAAEFTGTAQDAWTQTLCSIESYAPREILYPASLAPLIKQHFNHRTAHYNNTNSHQPGDSSNPVVAQISNSSHANLPFVPATALDDWLWHIDICRETLLNRFNVRTLEAFNLETKPNAIRAAGVCLRYASETQKLSNTHVNDIRCFETNDYLVLDKATVRNLELIESQDGNANRSLLSVIDNTQTAMGARLLRASLLRPSVRRGEIEARLNAVAELYESQLLRDDLRAGLKEITDLERLTGRINMNTATAKDLISLRRSITQIPQIKVSLKNCSSSLLGTLLDSLDELANVKAQIQEQLTDEPPLTLTEGGTIRCGFNAELDELRDLSGNVKTAIAALENRERARSGINALRVRYKNITGYYIEVSRAHAERVPSDYERRQTLVNAERFTTPELKTLEQKVLSAEERIIELEIELFNNLRARLAAETKRLQATTRALALLDVIAALAHTAKVRRYVKPVLHDADEMEIVRGRHAVIEAFSSAQFVPNDLAMNNSTNRLLLITGPNMGGKSTILRQTGLIAVLGQIGSFVPADAARLPVFDRIWTRVGANDDISRGRSTFMVEMTETAAIMRGVTNRSLVLLDEIGRGTATFDGLSIAWAVAEQLHNSDSHAAKTLFATHYHELTELAEQLPGARNYHIRVAERDDEIFFLYRFEAGCASKSYGIEVARLAGMPVEVLSRARQILNQLEKYELQINGNEPLNSFGSDDTNCQDFAVLQAKHSNLQADASGLSKTVATGARRKLAMQATLFDLANQKLMDEIRNTNLEKITAEQALTFLMDLQQKLI